MSLQRYLTILQRALRQAMPSSLGKPRFAGRGGIAEMAEQFVHIGIAIAMFVASAWNQVSAALGTIPLPENPQKTNQGRSQTESA